MQANGVTHVARDAETSGDLLDRVTSLSHLLDGFVLTRASISADSWNSFGRLKTIASEVSTVPGHFQSPASRTSRDRRPAPLVKRTPARGFLAVALDEASRAQAGGDAELSTICRPANVRCTSAAHRLLEFADLRRAKARRSSCRRIIR